MSSPVLYKTPGQISASSHFYTNSCWASTRNTWHKPVTLTSKLKEILFTLGVQEADINAVTDDLITEDFFFLLANITLWKLTRKEKKIIIIQLQGTSPWLSEAEWSRQRMFCTGSSQQGEKREDSLDKRYRVEWHYSLWWKSLWWNIVFHCCRLPGCTQHGRIRSKL